MARFDLTTKNGSGPLFLPTNIKSGEIHLFHKDQSNDLLHASN